MKTGIKSIELSDFAEIHGEVTQLNWITAELRHQCPGVRIDSTDTIGHPMRMWEWGRNLLNVKEVFGYPFALHKISVLDVGTAVSLIGPALAYLGCDVQEVDVDISFQPERLKIKKFFDASDFPGSFDWKQMGFGRLHELDKKYDVVMSISTIEHVETSLEKKAWKEMYDRLKPGGLMLVTMDLFEEAGKPQIYDWVRYTNYSMDTVHDRVEELKSYGMKTIGEEDWAWHGVHVDDGSFAYIAMRKGK